MMNRKRMAYVKAFMDGCNFQTRIKNKIHHDRCLEQAGKNAVHVYPFRFVKIRKLIRRKK